MDQQFETKARETMRLVAFMMAIDESFENIKAFQERIKHEDVIGEYTSEIYNPWWLIPLVVCIASGWLWEWLGRKNAVNTLMSC